MANRPRAGRLSRAVSMEETDRLRDEGLTHREIAERLDVSVVDGRKRPAVGSTWGKRLG
jgi:hypothetical protein